MLQLVPENSAILKAVCSPFDFANPSVDQKTLADDLIATMRANRGIGLAAPQVGIALRCFVMGDAGYSVVCFNPEIVECSSEMIRDEEGCLSFPDLYLKIDRPQWLVGRFHDATGTVVEQRFLNRFARCFAHELDHLNGITFTTVVGPLALKMAQGRRRKKLRGKMFNEFNQR